MNKIICPHCRHEFTLPTFNELSWAEIKATPNPKQRFKIGDTKLVELYTGETNEFAIADFDRENVKIIFIARTLLDSEYSMNPTNTNEGGWKNSHMRNVSIQRVFKLLPKDLQDIICPVTKVTTGIKTEDKFWLLSETEVFGKNEYSKGNDGKQYEIFKDENNRIKYRNGQKDWYWLRSPYSSTSTSFCFVNSDGSAYYISASGSIGVCLGFGI
jgi:hypothetical protein